MLAKSEITGDYDYKAILETHIIPDRELFELQIENQDGSLSYLTGTDDHPFYVKDHGWKGLASLSAGDLLAGRNGELTTVAVRRLARKALTYNLSVADYQTFVVTESDVWVHNCPLTPVKPGDKGNFGDLKAQKKNCLLYTSPSPRDLSTSRMPSSA